MIFTSPRELKIVYKMLSWNWILNNLNMASKTSFFILSNLTENNFHYDNWVFICILVLWSQWWLMKVLYKWNYYFLLVIICLYPCNHCAWCRDNRAKIHLHGIAFCHNFVHSSICVCSDLRPPCNCQKFSSQFSNTHHLHNVEFC